MYIHEFQLGSSSHPESVFSDSISIFAVLDMYLVLLAAADRGSGPGGLAEREAMAKTQQAEARGA